MKGIIVLYVNTNPEDHQDLNSIFKLVREQNAELIEMLQNIGYQFLFVPTSREASRIEKIDMDKPFPRYVAPHVDVHENDRFFANAAKMLGEENNG